MRFDYYFADGGNLSDEAGVQTVPERKDIDIKYLWDLTHIYKDEQAWEKDFSEVQNNLHKYKEYEGKLTSSASRLLSLLKFDEYISSTLDKLHLYVMLSRDSDMRVSHFHGLEGRVRSLATQASAISSFIRPELLSSDEQHILRLISNEPELEQYRHFFDELFKAKPHTLSKKEEAILASAGEITAVAYDAFSILKNSDLQFPSLKDESGNSIEVSHARYSAALYSKDRNFRKEFFKAYYRPFITYANTFTALFNGNLKSKIFYAKARNYRSAREAALHRNSIPLSVYDNLINSVSAHLAPMHRWMELKKKILGLEELHPYDIYISLFEENDQNTYSFEKGRQLVTESLKIMGDNYLTTLDTAFDNRWLDVFETRGKRSGAYSSGTTFGVHPYILLNWTGLLNDVFTLTHEIGHNMHSYLTQENQPYVYADYSIFLAEVASTFNESLLLDYLLENSTDKNTRLLLIQKYLDNVSATFYRQTMFAEFEMEVYNRLENGKTLTTDDLRLLYKTIYQKYMGASLTVDEEEEYTWARVPHFYYNFYVYQYATGFAASEALAARVKQEGKPAIDAYIGFLKAGKSDYPLEILKRAGVDMTSPAPIEATANRMNYMLDELEALLTIDKN